MSETVLAGHRGREHDAAAPTHTAAHGSRSEHLANERTHLAYMRTAISLISLGITVNRFSLYLKQHDELPNHPERVDLLGGTAAAGAGMVIFALLLMLAALYRYKVVEEAIDLGIDNAGRRLVVLLTLSVIVIGAGGILWMFRA